LHIPQPLDRGIRFAHDYFFKLRKAVFGSCIAGNLEFRFDCVDAVLPCGERVKAAALIIPTTMFSTASGCSWADSGVTTRAFSE
jgi:hypothetical protein